MSDQGESGHVPQSEFLNGIVVEEIKGRELVPVIDLVIDLARELIEVVRLDGRNRQELSADVGTRDVLVEDVPRHRI